MTNTQLTSEQRFQNARLSLDGLCVGDCFGQRFFAPGTHALVQLRQAPPAPWVYTDDTAMAISIVRTLLEAKQIDQDKLAAHFADEYNTSPHRGYGAGAHGLLAALAGGEDWRIEAPAMFEGTGSMGNGGAMRAAPIGGYFADDLDKVAEQAALSAEVTHAHPEGQAGAVAVAIAAALAYRASAEGVQPKPKDFITQVVDYTPESLTRTNLKQAAVLPGNLKLNDVVRTLGNGSRIIAWDTAPFCVWVSAHRLDHYVEALWTCVRAGGDIDTTAAIVGGIVSLFTGQEGIPEEWKRASEPLPIGRHGML
ncbi:MAG: ADP-ribosylglycohydrolase family protein [Planctomycetota bacterium]